MIQRSLSDSILTIGPSPEMKGGIAQVLDTYFSEVIESPKFIPETIDGGRPRRMAASVVAVWTLVKRLMTDKDIKIVHLHTASGVSFVRSSIYAKIARLFGRKVILHIHGANFQNYFDSNKKFVRRNLAKADRVIALSNSWLDFFCRKVGIDNVSVVPNITATPVLTAQRPKDGAVEALFLGQLGERKGVFDLLQAIDFNKDALSGRFVLNIGGNGETARVQRYIRDHSLEDVVRFHGWVAGSDKTDLLSRSSIFILPSYAEGLPISVLEAMSYRLAIISTPVGGIPEVVDDSNGALIAPNDIDDLGREILRLVDDPQQIQEKGERSYIKVARHLPESVSKELTSIYRLIIDSTF